MRDRALLATSGVRVPAMMKMPARLSQPEVSRASTAEVMRIGPPTWALARPRPAAEWKMGHFWRGRGLTPDEEAGRPDSGRASWPAG
jgi:hypothetical protein